MYPLAIGSIGNFIFSHLFRENCPARFEGYPIGTFGHAHPGSERRPVVQHGLQNYDIDVSTCRRVDVSKNVADYLAGEGYGGYGMTRYDPKTDKNHESWPRICGMISDFGTLGYPCVHYKFILGPWSHLLHPVAVAQGPVLCWKIPFFSVPHGRQRDAIY